MRRLATPVLPGANNSTPRRVKCVRDSMNVFHLSAYVACSPPTCLHVTDLLIPDSRGAAASGKPSSSKVSVTPATRSSHAQEQHWTQGARAAESLTLVTKPRSV